MRALRSALVCTHHLFQWSGSELVALELIEALVARGVAVTAFVPFADPEFCAEALPKDVALVTEAGDISLAEFDLVYAQHQTQVAVYAAQDWSQIDHVPVLVCAHLSSRDPMEFPGPYLEPTGADIVLANSMETRARLSAFGLLRQDIGIWANPAPSAFAAAPATRQTPALRSILAVSHHPPTELSEALDLLEAQGVRVTRLGQDTVARRVQPADLFDHDAVVTIGKTVQYALRARRPVFCYDHFAGPGWLGDHNFAAAAEVNFSGRGTSEQRAAEALAAALQGGFENAWGFAQGLDSADLRPFDLDAELERLLDQVHLVAEPAVAQAIKADREGFVARLAHEAELYALVDRHYGAAHKSKETNVAMAKILASLREDNARLNERLIVLRDRTDVLRDRNEVLRDRAEVLQGRIDTLKAQLRQRRPS